MITRNQEVPHFVILIVAKAVNLPVSFHINLGYPDGGSEHKKSQESKQEKR
ncbi:hypothetical protein E1J53_0015085 [Lewinella sp. W8]|nr:hypothetical protein [Lewinella sp. W8]